MKENVGGLMSFINRRTCDRTIEFWEPITKQSKDAPGDKGGKEEKKDESQPTESLEFSTHKVLMRVSREEEIGREY